MDITKSVKEIKTSQVYLHINGVDIPIYNNFRYIVGELISCDGFFTIPHISDNPTVKKMIEAGLVQHNYRGCYATQLLRDNEEEIFRILEE